MFILRTKGTMGAYSNDAIGDHYDIIYSDNEHFKETYEKLNLSPKAKIEDCHAIILCGRIIPLWKSTEYYIMTENGNTFEKITFK